MRLSCFFFFLFSLVIVESYFRALEIENESKFKRLSNGISALFSCTSLTVHCVLYSRIFSVALSISFLLQRSILLSKTLSAKQTYSTDSFSHPSDLSSFILKTIWEVSHTVMQASNLVHTVRSSSNKKVCNRGAGSAIPVVSMII